MGVIAGLGASKWLERKARRRLAKLLPVHQLPVRVGAELAAKVRDEARARAEGVRDAVSAGRAAIKAREEELRDRIYGSRADDVVVELRPVTSSRPSRLSLQPSSPERRTKRL